MTNYPVVPDKPIEGEIVWEPPTTRIRFKPRLPIIIDYPSLAEPAPVSLQDQANMASILELIRNRCGRAKPTE